MYVAGLLEVSSSFSILEKVVTCAAEASLKGRRAAALEPNTFRNVIDFVSTQVWSSEGLLVPAPGGRKNQMFGEEQREKIPSDGARGTRFLDRQICGGGEPGFSLSTRNCRHVIQPAFPLCLWLTPVVFSFLSLFLPSTPPSAHPVPLQAHTYLSRYYREHNVELSKLLHRLGLPLPSWLREELQKVSSFKLTLSSSSSSSSAETRGRARAVLMFPLWRRKDEGTLRPLFHHFSHWTSSPTGSIRLFVSSTPNSFQPLKCCHRKWDSSTRAAYV